MEWPAHLPLVGGGGVSQGLKLVVGERERKTPV